MELIEMSINREKLLNPVKLSKTQKAKLYSKWIDYLIKLSPNERYEEIQELKSFTYFKDKRLREKHFDLFFQTFAYAMDIDLTKL